MAKPVMKAIFLSLVLVTFAVQAWALDENLADATVKAMKWPGYEGAKTPTIDILKNTSQVLRFDRSIMRVAISNVAICDVTMVGEKDVLVYAKTAGNANLLVWDTSDAISTYYLQSTLDLAKLHGILQDIDPNADLKIVPFNDTAALYGTTETSLKLKQIQEASKAFDKNVISYVKLRESKQVLLEVRFAEIDRKANKDFKLDAQLLTPHYPLTSTTGQTGGTTKGSDTFTTKFIDYKDLPSVLGPETVGNFISAYVNRDFQISAYLKWLEQKNILKFIARPNLVAKDGEEASFVVGGEFPIPTVTTNGVQINYREFGTKLKFTPEILDADMIRLKTETEVSDLDFSSTVTSGGTTVPVITKRSNTTISEMRDSETLVISGLVYQKINRVNRKMPFLGDIPLVKTLFSTNEFSRTDVELVVVITPHIVRPMQLEEKREYYDKSQVKEITRAFKPVYPDKQADALDRLMAQNEVPRDFYEDDAAEFSKAVAKRMERREARKKLSIGPAVSPPIKSDPQQKLSNTTVM